MPYTPASKLNFCDNLSNDWPALADLLGIKPADRAKFARGNEAREIWDWLEARGKLPDLPATLRQIGRGDLADALIEQPRIVFSDYHQRRIDQWSDEKKYALDKRFVQLTLWLNQGDDASGSRYAADARKFRDLREVLEADPKYPALVLLGPPGSGKSTLLRHVELEYAKAALATGDNAPTVIRFTFFVPLNLYKTSDGTQPPPPKVWLEQQWAAYYPDLPALDTLCQQGELILLLDALNEMPHQGGEHLEAWRDFLARWVTTRRHNRVIFSCRTQDYTARLSTKDLVTVHEVRIERLGDGQIQEFLEKYCPQPEQATKLWQQLRRDPRQLDLYRSPYYLKLLVDQASATGQIPTGRAALFSGFVRQALNREIDARNPLFKPGDLLTAPDCERLTGHAHTGCDLPTEGPLFPSLSRLAYRMQETERTSEQSQVRLARPQVLQLLGEAEAPTGFWSRLWSQRPPPDRARAERLLKAGRDLRLLDLDDKQQDVMFFHQLLQEYFAARRLALHLNPRLLQTVWRVGQVKPDLPTLLKTLADVDPLPLLKPTGWEETAVLAAAMTTQPEAFVQEVMAVNLPLAGRCAGQPDVAISAALKAQIQQALLARTQDVNADLRARIAAGLALGWVGHPEFERQRGPHGDYLWPPLVAIPAGTYPIGSNEGRYDDESPAHTVTLAAFSIGKFPVTNAEWALFMEADGYEDDRWWETEAARAWRRGEGTAEGPKQVWRENRQTFQQQFDRIRALWHEGRITSKQADDWEAIAQMDDAAFEKLLDEWYPPGRQTQPLYWNDDTYNNPAQPVVGIGWHEARAYCAWLSAQTGQLFRLPTEAEWEAATRGQAGRRYAYGDDFDVSRCNIFDTHIRRTTPIGVFPGGATPEGTVDLTGNTWDWTSSLYQPYPYVANDGREVLDAEGLRGVRGGSWRPPPADARAAFRYRSSPAARYGSLGLRLVCSSPMFF